ncbi:hypothetical protein ACEWY4_018116 [Coilia grayii]|uniref:Scaffolding anchor of CK1 domain-containing protein n=1 Tax=Coilia grayii TaxID=363190 RepID=A0ABD1JJ17_9TELE
MESDFSAMSSMSEQLTIEDSVPGLYKETNRLALYALLQGGQKAYQDFLKAEGLTDFLSEEEIAYILENKKWPSEDDDEDLCEGMENAPSTYCPMESDVEVPDLDLGWPEARLDHLETNVRMFFHPPRQNMPNIKTLVRKFIREAKMVIAVAMDIFSDVDIFRDLVEVSTRGVVVYILLDDQQFDSFFRMSEKANVPLQKLWNVRIRTVKGHEYRCQSGAKFHGAMDQKFMLVDCHTVLYGSYSFMWSYEKINLSMVLLITGKLVACYDEEFRRLFARSIIPALLIQPTPSSTEHFGGMNQAPKFGLHSTQLFERSHSFDPAQLKTIRGRMNVLNHSDRPEEGTHANGAAIRRGLNFQRNLAADLTKHTSSYAALQNRMYSSMRQRSSVVTGKGTETQEKDLFSSLGQLNHLSQNRQPAQEGNSLQGPQPFLSASEMSLHKWRIESYLKHDHIPADSTESLDCMSIRSDSKSSLLSSHSSRPNLIYKVPEQPVEPRSMQSPFLGRRAVTSVYSSLQRAKDNCLNKDLKIPEISAERKISKEPITSSSTQPHPPEPVKPSTVINHPPVQATDQPLPETNHQPDPVAEDVISNLTSPTPSLLHSPESSIIVENKQTADSLKDEIPSSQKLIETHRSISHYGINTIDDRKNQTYGWQEPPSRTASAVNLGKVLDASLMKGSNLKRLRPFSNSNTTRLSLIEIPEEKEGLGSRRNLEELSPVPTEPNILNLTTLTKAQQAPIQANVHISERGFGMAGTITSPTPSYSSGGRAPHVATPALTRAMNHQWGSSKNAEEERNTAAAAAASPRTLSALDVAANAHHRVDHGSFSSVATVESVMSNPGEGRYGIPEVKRNKVYSRFEHFLSVERRTPEKTATDRMNAYAAEKRRTLFMGTPTSSYSRYQTQTDNNRLGKFIQRVGSFISKNK